MKRMLLLLSTVLALALPVISGATPDAGMFVASSGVQTTDPVLNDNTIAQIEEGSLLFAAADPSTGGSNPLIESLHATASDHWPTAVAASGVAAGVANPAIDS